MTSPAGARIAAAAGGVVLAVASAFVSFGGSLIAILAVVIGWLAARRRGRPFTRGRSWLVGVGAVGAVVLVAMGAYAAQLPRNSYSAFRRALDSTQTAAPAPAPPEWLRRITPPGAQQQAPLTDALVKSHAFTIWAVVMGVGFTVALVAAYAGTLGWAASMLILYGATGRWLPRATPSGATR